MGCFYFAWNNEGRGSGKTSGRYRKWECTQTRGRWTWYMQVYLGSWGVCYMEAVHSHLTDTGNFRTAKRWNKSFRVDIDVLTHVFLSVLFITWAFVFVLIGVFHKLFASEENDVYSSLSIDLCPVGWGNNSWREFRVKAVQLVSHWSGFDYRIFDVCFYWYAHREMGHNEFCFLD